MSAGCVDKPPFTACRAAFKWPKHKFKQFNQVFINLNATTYGTQDTHLGLCCQSPVLLSSSRSGPNSYHSKYNSHEAECSISLMS